MTLIISVPINFRSLLTSAKNRSIIITRVQQRLSRRTTTTCRVAAADFLSVYTHSSARARSPPRHLVPRRLILLPLSHFVRPLTTRRRKKRPVAAAAAAASCGFLHFFCFFHCIYSGLRLLPFTSLAYCLYSLCSELFLET